MAPNQKPSSPIDYPSFPSFPEEEDLHYQQQHEEEEYEEYTSPEEELDGDEEGEEQVSSLVPEDPAKVDDKCDAPLTVKAIARNANALGFSTLNEDLVKMNLGLVEASKREEMEKQWKELHKLEFQLVLKRFRLLAEQISIMRDAQLSSTRN